MMGVDQLFWEIFEIYSNMKLRL